MKPFYENGFWWWWNPDIKDWMVGCAPSIGLPTWWDLKRWPDPRLRKNRKNQT